MSQGAWLIIDGFLKMFIHLFAAVLGLRCYAGFPLVVVSGATLVSLCELLTVEASLVAEHGLHPAVFSTCSWAQ